MLQGKPDGRIRRERGGVKDYKEKSLSKGAEVEES